MNKASRPVARESGSIGKWSSDHNKALDFSLNEQTRANHRFLSAYRIVNTGKEVKMKCLRQVGLTKRLIVVGSLLVLVWKGASDFATFLGHGPLQFTQEVWSTADSETRGYMVDDLLVSNLLVGKSDKVVRELLGSPDRTTEFQFHYNVGFRGVSPHLPMAFSYTLVIDFDERGFVRQADTQD